MAGGRVWQEGGGGRREGVAGKRVWQVRGCGR